MRTPTPEPVLVPTNTPYPDLTGYFKVLILDDTSSLVVDENLALTLLNEANPILLRLTGFEFQAVAYEQVSPRAGETREDMATRYMLEHPETDANGIILFSYGSDDFIRYQLGGYAIATRSLPGVRNTFGGKDYLPVAVINPEDKYAMCGYNETYQLTSNVSLGGQCRNRPGTACVEHNGYSMCEGAINDLYASTTTYLTAADIVHEFFHGFGYMDVLEDHYNDRCAEKMGWQPLDWNDPQVLNDAQFSVNICPDVIAMFKESYQP